MWRGLNPKATFCTTAVFKKTLEATISKVSILNVDTGSYLCVGWSVLEYVAIRGKVTLGKEYRPFARFGLFSALGWEWLVNVRCAGFCGADRRGGGMSALCTCLILAVVLPMTANEEQFLIQKWFLPLYHMAHRTVVDQLPRFRSQRLIKLS